MDAAFSRHHGSDLADRFWLPLSRSHSCHHRRNPLTAYPDGGDGGPYAYHLAGSSRWIYVVGAVVALYFNVFVLVVQSFLHLPALHALAPNGSEPPFAIAQGIVLVLFIVAGYPH